jgi:hypothetical protein
MMRTFILSLLLFYTLFVNGQPKVVIDVNDIKLKWNSDTTYKIPVEVTNLLDSSIFVIARPNAFNISYNFPGEFTIFFNNEVKLNSNAGPDAIAIQYLVGPFFEEIKPGCKKQFEVRVFSWDFKSPKDYQIQFKYSLKKGNDLHYIEIVNSNSFNISFY